jgi:alkaline phosphatase
MKDHRLWAFGLFCLSAFFAQGQKGPVFTSTVVPTSPKNVIILLAEGLGLTQISAGIYTNGIPSLIERFPYTGLQKALSADALIADAGMEATAISSGIMPMRDMIGLGQQKKPVKNIFEEAKARGFSTGIISTGPLTAAAPAAFVAHLATKAGPEAIAEAYLKGHVDFFIGAGRQAFAERSGDHRDLISELQAKGVVTAEYLPGEISLTTFDFKKDFGAFYEVASLQEDRENFILPAVRLGSVYLKNHSARNGFILVIHQSQLYESSLKKDTDQLLVDIRAFSKVVEAIFEFAAGDRETLVIVTGTPEASGLAINPGSQRGQLSVQYGSTGPTGAMIPVFAFGPGAVLFTGVYQNTEIHRKLLQALGWR